MMNLTQERKMLVKLKQVYKNYLSFIEGRLNEIDGKEKQDAAREGEDKKEAGA